MSSLSKALRGPILKTAFSALLLGACILTYVAATEAFTEDAADNVISEVVMKGDVEETVLANGVLEPTSVINVGAQVSGQLRSLKVTLGQSVKQGDLIAEIDPKQQENALRIAEAAKANISAQRQARKIELNQAERVLKRNGRLLLKRVISQEAFEAAEATFLGLQAQIKSIDAQLVQASAEVENARVNLGYTRIMAPMDGTVVAVVTRAGQTLNSSQSAPTIVVLAQLDTMRVKVQISEADVSRVQVGQKVWFTIMGDSQTRFEATLAQIEPAPVSIGAESPGGTASNSLGSAAVYYNGLFEIPNPTGKLRPMMTAQVNIVVGSATDVTLVPWAALSSREADGQYRVKVRTGKGDEQVRRVAIGLTDKLKAQVLSGLTAGERVAIPADGEASDPTLEF